MTGFVATAWPPSKRRLRWTSGPKKYWIFHPKGNCETVKKGPINPMHTEGMHGPSWGWFIFLFFLLRVCFDMIYVAYVALIRNVSIKLTWTFSPCFLWKISPWEKRAIDSARNSERSSGRRRRPWWMMIGDCNGLCFESGLNNFSMRFPSSSPCILSWRWFITSKNHQPQPKFLRMMRMVLA